jgi:hypothetical protein
MPPVAQQKVRRIGSLGTEVLGTPRPFSYTDLCRNQAARPRRQLHPRPGRYAVVCYFAPIRVPGRLVWCFTATCTAPDADSPMARDVFYARRGRINARVLSEQRNTCGCLTLILVCVVFWQAPEISRVLSQCDPDGNGIDLSLLEHLSPIE